MGLRKHEEAPAEEPQQQEEAPAAEESKFDAEAALTALVAHNAAGDTRIDKAYLAEQASKLTLHVEEDAEGYILRTTINDGREAA